MAGACVVDTIAGSGTIATETRPVSGFSAVSLSGSSQLIIEQTGTESLTVSADDNVLPYVKTEVRGRTLMLGFTDGAYVRPTRPVVFTLGLKTLEQLDLSGSGKIEARHLNLADMTLAISGSGEMSGDGLVDDLDVSISGSGRYLGEDMKSRRARVDISGSGRAVVAAADRLSVEVSGSGRVDYLGDPQVTQHISGSGSVRRR